MLQEKVTLRCIIAGFILAMFLCAINSYLTLSFGIMEEGPAIAVLFFFAVYFRSKMKITTTEMVVVATMGSAGGVLGFMANFFAARVMVELPPYTFWEMTFFTITSSVIGLMAVVLLRQILVIENDKLPEGQKLPWVGAKAVQGMIDALLKAKDSMQPRYLVFFTTAATAYVIFNDDGGVGWFPFLGMFTVFGLSAYGAGIAFSPFVWGGAYLMGFRTCVGFFVAGIALFVIGHILPEELEMQASPHRFVWPGIMFLVTSGLTGLAMRWRSIIDALKSLTQARTGGDSDPIMSKHGLIIFLGCGLIFVVAMLYFVFELTILVIVGMLVIGGLILNLIATRAAAQTYFNPARVMGILLQGVAALLGGASVGANLTGGGIVAGAGGQGGNLTNDMAYGFWYKVRSRLQFWTQASTLIPCAMVSAAVFMMINHNVNLAIDSEEIAAPIAKIWATMAMIFDPDKKLDLPTYAMESMWIAGIAGIIWTMLESREGLRKFLPCSIGFGLGLILPIFYNVGFFAGGLVMWFLLPRFLNFKDVTLNTIAISCIVGEGVGGMISGTLRALGIISGGGGH